MLARSYGSNVRQLSNPYEAGDVDRDGVVNFNDLVMLAQRYNKTLELPAVAVAAAPSRAKRSGVRSAS
jgi:hypothetical protein